MEAGESRLPCATAAGVTPGIATPTSSRVRIDGSTRRRTSGWSTAPPMRHCSAWASSAAYAVALPRLKAEFVADRQVQHDGDRWPASTAAAKSIG